MVTSLRQIAPTRVRCAPLDGEDVVFTSSIMDMFVDALGRTDRPAAGRRDMVFVGRSSCTTSIASSDSVTSGGRTMVRVRPHRLWRTESVARRISAGRRLSERRDRRCLAAASHCASANRRAPEAACDLHGDDRRPPRSQLGRAYRGRSRPFGHDRRSRRACRAPLPSLDRPRHVVPAVRRLELASTVQACDICVIPHREHIAAAAVFNRVLGRFVRSVNLNCLPRKRRGLLLMLQA
jgi:hypothetical protein